MKMNKTLLLGFSLLTILLLVVLFPWLLSAQNPYALSLIKFWLNDAGALQIATAPYPPGPSNLIGSDQLGRDLLSFLAYGTRLTLGLALGVMVGRMILAIPVGIWAGMGNPIAKRSIDRFNLVLTTIPPLLIAIIVLRIDLFTSLYKAESIALFIFTLSLLGWSKLAAVVYKSTEHIMSETYILSEKAIGKSELKIVFEHLIPHLLPELVILAVMEIAAALTLLMQLGIFSIFIGNLKIIKDSSSGGYSYFNVSFEPEWSSLLGSARDYIRVAPWIALSAGFMFFYTVLAFNLLGEGLRQHYQALKASPQIKRVSTYRKSLPWLITIIALFAISLWPQSINYEPVYDKSMFKADTQDALTELIHKQLKTEGMEALSSDGYIQSFNAAPSFMTKSSSLSLNGEILTNEAYQILAGSNVSASAKIVDGTALVFDQTDLSGLCLLVDTKLVSFNQLLNNAKNLKERGAAAVLISNETPSGSPLAAPLPIISLSKQQPLIGSKFQLELLGQTQEGLGKNFAATFKGSEPTLAHNQVILLMDYHSLNPQNQGEKLSFYFNLIHNLSTHRKELKRSISIVLTDGNEGLHHYAQHGLIQNKNVNLVLDLRALEGKSFDKLSFSDTLSPISRYYGYVFAKQFKTLAKPVLAERPMLLSDENAWLFKTNGLTTLNFKASPGDKSSEALTKLLLKSILINGR